MECTHYMGAFQVQFIHNINLHILNAHTIMIHNINEHVLNGTPEQAV